MDNMLSSSSKLWHDVANDLATISAISSDIVWEEVQSP